MEVIEYLKLATDKTEAGDLIKDNNLTETVVKLMSNYAEFRVKNCSIPAVVGRSEQLKAFLRWAENEWMETPPERQWEQMFEEYLKSL